MQVTKRADFQIWGKEAKKRAEPYPETLRSDCRLNPLESLADDRTTESLWSDEDKPEKLHVLSSPKSRDFGGAFAAEMDLLTRFSFFCTLSPWWLLSWFLVAVSY